MRRKSAKTEQSDNSSHRAIGKPPALFRRKKNGASGSRPCKPFFTPVVQPKLTVNAPDDKYEKEADRVADAVMRMPDSLISRQPVEEEEEELQMKEKSPAVQRKCAECEEEEKRLQRTPLRGNNTPFFQRKETGEGKVNPQTSTFLQTTKGRGKSLPDNTRNWMENRFGTDFSGVKIHTDSKAVQLSRDLNAKAFTLGRDIYFNQGEFTPGTNTGKRLLAHELMHTIQQKGVIRRSPETEEEDLYIRKVPGGDPYMDLLDDWKEQVDHAIRDWETEERVSEAEWNSFINNLIGAGLTVIGLGLTGPAAAGLTMAEKAIGLLRAVPSSDDPIGKFREGMLEAYEKVYDDRVNEGVRIIRSALRGAESLTSGQRARRIARRCFENDVVEGLGEGETPTINEDRLRGRVKEHLDSYLTQIAVIGQKTEGVYGPMMARWLEGAHWKALALTGEGRYSNVGGKPTFITWISPKLKEDAIRATERINFGKVSHVHYGNLEEVEFPFFSTLDSPQYPPHGNQLVIERSSGTTRPPSRDVCPSCHGESGGAGSQFPEMEPEFDTDFFRQRDPFPGIDDQVLIEYIQSMEE